jgi:Trk K+ transport system NAD-binding subunit
MPRIAVIGLGRFGMSLARSLSRAGAEVLAIDRNGTLVSEISDDVAVAVRLDSTDDVALREQGVHKVDAAVVGIGTSPAPAAPSAHEASVASAPTTWSSRRSRQRSAGPIG